MYNGHVAGTQHFVYSCLLRGVQPGKPYGVELSETGFRGSQQYVPQFGQAVAFGA